MTNHVSCISREHKNWRVNYITHTLHLAQDTGILKPISDKCYVFVVIQSAHYSILFPVFLATDMVSGFSVHPPVFVCTTSNNNKACYNILVKLSHIIHVTLVNEGVYVYNMYNTCSPD